MKRRSFLALVGAALSAPARAQIWPTQPVRLVVPFAAGGPTDVAARLVGEALSSVLPHRVVVENRTGAGAVVGTGLVANAAPDGQTMLMATIAHVVAPALFSALAFDPLADFRGVALVGTVPQIVLVRSAFPGTLTDLIDAARREPGALAYGSAGNGSAQHLASEFLKRRADIDLVHVPYRGAGPAVADMLAGQIAVVIDSAATALAMVRNGQAKALAVTSAQRLPHLPDVPTVAETLPGYEAYTWNAILAPRNTPAPTIERMNRATNQVLGEAKLRGRLEEIGIQVVTDSTPAGVDAFMAREAERWQRVLREAGIRPD